MTLDENTRQRGIRTLHILLILSFIYTGMWTLCHFMLGLTGPDMRQAMLETYQSMAEKNESFSA